LIAVTVVFGIAVLERSSGITQHDPKVVNWFVNCTVKYVKIPSLLNESIKIVENESLQVQNTAYNARILFYKFSDRSRSEHSDSSSRDILII
jgi:hypothetical protein